MTRTFCAICPKKSWYLYSAYGKCSDEIKGIDGGVVFAKEVGNHEGICCFDKAYCHVTEILDYERISLGITGVHYSCDNYIDVYDRF